jgi:predicted HAD superfamily Cof-like phosphohydrolase
MNPIIRKVIEFNQQVLDIQPREIGVMIEGEAKATVKALNEEATEFQEAFDGHDILGQVDALVDSIYFAVGALYKMGLTGLQIEAAFDVVHECNMKKHLGRVAKRDNPLGDAVKPEGWVGPEEGLAGVLGV